LNDAGYLAFTKPVTIMFQTETSAQKEKSSPERSVENSSFRKVITTFRKLHFNSSTNEFINKNILDLELFDEMDIGVYLIDYHTGRYAYSNNALATMFGLRRDDIVNKSVSIFASFVHPDDYPKVIEILSKTGDIIKKMRQSDRSKVKFRIFYRFLKADGSYCWCMQSNKIIEDTVNETQIDLGMIICLPDHQTVDRVTGYLKTDKKCIEISGVMEADSPISLLSARELEVITLVSKGFNSREISLKLMLSEQTIKIHRKKILKKLKVNSSIQAIRLIGLG
jgi:PAS domain S-box-containing protein